MQTLGKVLNLIFCSAHFFGVSALCVSFALCWQDKYNATTVILSPDQKFALLQYSYTKVQVHFASLRMKLGNKGLGTTKQEAGLESRDVRGWENVREMQEDAWTRWMSAGERWSWAGGRRRRETGGVCELGSRGMTAWEEKLDNKWMERDHKESEAGRFLWGDKLEE